MAFFGEGFRAAFLKVWLSATRRETQIPFGNDNKGMTTKIRIPLRKKKREGYTVR
jgi:hypothetical protein